MTLFHRGVPRARGANDSSGKPEGFLEEVLASLGPIWPVYRWQWGAAASQVPSNLLWAGFCPQKILTLNSYLPAVPQKETIFGERAFKKVMKLKRGH